MKLRQFQAKNVHGYINIDVTFHDDLTFLTGINGSGKTTVIYSLVALITPSLQILANISFSEMKLTLEQDGRDIEISAVKDEKAITLKASDTQETFTFPLYASDPDESYFRNAEREAEFYKSLMLTHSPNGVLSFISKLPTPMFLDLDRRSRNATERSLARERAHYRTMRRGRNIFSVSLIQSLMDATALAESSYSELQIRLRRLGETSRRDLILSLLTLQPAQQFGGPIVTPKSSDLRALNEVKKASLRLPELLQIPEGEISSRLQPFLDQLQRYAKDIPHNADPETLLRSAPQDQRTLNALIGWSANRPQLDKISQMMAIVSSFSKESDQAASSINAYLNMVNRFLKDSGKELFFDDAGWLSFRVSHLPEPQPVSSLSSGEAQIFVILTHLAFNPAAREANVFIVDEPELSLHVQWQELFVESVQSANPNVQYIMATHSPSIILDRTDRCKDLSRYVGV